MSPRRTTLAEDLIAHYRARARAERRKTALLGALAFALVTLCARTFLQACCI
jgi:hypothetical protein